jgi:seryl-tRNA synthetase
MIDFERGAKTSGSKFYFTTGNDAWKEWCLITRMLQYHMLNGYEMVLPPHLVRRQTMEWAGQLPRFEGDFYEIEKDGLVLIPTAESALVGLHQDELLKEEDLPKKYVAVSPCYRREAGSYGSKEKGLKRVHQFNKVELFVICKPQDSGWYHEEMLRQITTMLGPQGMNLEHRVVELPETGPDARSPVSAKTYDIELKHGDEWLEVSSISNTEDRQSKPALIRYKDKATGKNVKCHLLNGSGVALPRLLMALGDRFETHWRLPMPLP